MKTTSIISLSAPHIHDWRTTAKAAWICSATLVPVAVASVFLYGTSALYIWLAATFGAILAEMLTTVFTKHLSIVDGSAVLTGLLVASVLPPGAPLYIPFAASLFAILAVKSVFGGLGSNWMNPALGGIAFAYANWPEAMRIFRLPINMGGLDGLSASTPLGLAKGLAGSESTFVMDALRNAGYPLSSTDIMITGFLNDSLFSRIGARLPEGYIDLILGFKPGALGECALIVVLLGSIVLLASGLIKLEIPLGMILAFTVLSRVFGTGLPGEQLFKGDILFALSGGGFLMAAFYMAADPVTSPVDRRLAGIYGLITGGLAFVFRRWGAYSEGVVYAILTMNILVPTVERYLPARLKIRMKAASI